MGLKVYIACAWIKGEEAIEARAAAVKAGLEVTSRWIDRVPAKNLDTTYDYTKDVQYSDEDHQREAARDFDDIDNCDWFILINSAKSEGKVVETGIALAMGRPIVVVGPKTNTFLYFTPPDMYHVNTIAEAIDVVLTKGA